MELLLQLLHDMEWAKWHSPLSLRHEVLTRGGLLAWWRRLTRGTKPKYTLRFTLLSILVLNLTLDRDSPGLMRTSPCRPPLAYHWVRQNSEHKARGFPMAKNLKLPMLTQGKTLIVFP
jgi:hypothetical protein